jgi:hypothetical protein
MFINMFYLILMNTYDNFYLYFWDENDFLNGSKILLFEIFF